MKKIILVVAIFATLLVQQGIAQDVSNENKPNALLSSYFSIKDALVSSDSKVAGVKAEEFKKILNKIDDKEFPITLRTALLKDADTFSKTKDLQKQRELFNVFSDDMYALAKTIKLSSDPIYKDYCPMKKSSWLSNTVAIKNPYYGSAMLTCGKIIETIE